ncbi:MAG: hypothetical protein ACREX4_06425 [Gammaproteobacteria bacterium]
MALVGIRFNLGDHRSLVPFAIVGFVALVYGVRQLYLHRHLVGNAWILFIAAFACFGSVAGQEYIEHAFRWEGVAKAFRLVIEEGSEITGFFLMLLAVVSMRQRLEPHLSDPPLTQPHLLPSMATIQTFILGGIILAVPIIVARSSVPQSWASFVLATSPA